MTANRRLPGLLGGFALVSLLSSPIAAQDVESTFARAVDLVEQGLRDDALVEFKKVLAQNPDAESAYQLWRSAESYVWTDLLVEGGEHEQVAKRFIALARAGKRMHRNDPDQIRTLVDQAFSSNIVDRKRAVLELRSNHGEYAVPQFAAVLADATDDDRRIAAITSLIDMGDVAVAPLVEVLKSDDRTQRLAAVQTLARIDDPRGNAMLALVANSDSEGGIRAAAQEAIGGADAAEALIELGWGYATQSARILPGHLIGEVIWDWNGRALESRPIPRFLYGGEMARKAFFAAIDAGADPVEAGAGLAYVGAVQSARAEDAAAGGEELPDDVAAHIENGLLASYGAGSAAADRALEQALRDPVDVGAAVQLCRILSVTGTTPGAGLNAALAAGDRGLSGEAAVALASVARRSNGAASTAAVQSLGNAISREIVRVAVVIDGNATRRLGVVADIEAAGFAAQSWTNGGSGLAAISRLPGVDLVVLADSLPDLTSNQVISELRAAGRTSEVPIVIVSDDASGAADIFGDQVQLVVDPSSSDYLAGVEELTGEIEGDRARAENLASTAATALAQLAEGGATDLSTVSDVLASVIGSRADSIAIPACKALASCGSTSEQLAAIANVISGEGSEDLRAAAGSALAGMLGKHAELAQGTDLHEVLLGVVSGDGGLDLRRAAASALGAFGTNSDLLRGLRLPVDN